MKKQILLLISLGIFYVGCKKDDSLNETNYQVDEYSEGILGHWKYDQIKSTTTITNYIIDPVFGSMTSEIISNSDTTINYPNTMNLGFIDGSPIILNYDHYYTYRYDNSFGYDRLIIDEENVVSSQDLFWLDGLMILHLDYSINGEILNNYSYPEPINYRISSMSETRMRLLYETRDSISISSNEYQIISTSETKTLLRVEELPLPLE